MLTRPAPVCKQTPDRAGSPGRGTRVHAERENVRKGNATRHMGPLDCLTAPLQLALHSGGKPRLQECPGSWTVIEARLWAAWVGEAAGTSGGRPLLPGVSPCQQAHTVALTRKAVRHVGATSHPRTYRNAVASSRGQVNVVWVCRHAAVSPGDVGSHVFTDAVDTLASTVGPCKTASRTVSRAQMSD